MSKPYKRRATTRIRTTVADFPSTERELLDTARSIGCQLLDKSLSGQLVLYRFTLGQKAIVQFV